MQSSLTSSSMVLLQPIIIAAADQSYYLVGVVDSNNNFVGLNQPCAHIVGSIAEAKAYLRGNNIFSALLELEFSYDEASAELTKTSLRQRILC